MSRRLHAGPGAPWRTAGTVPLIALLLTTACVTPQAPVDTLISPTSSTASTPAASGGASSGGSSGSDTTPPPSPTPTPTPTVAVAYTPDMVPVFQQDCVSCHSGSRPDGNYSMTSYQNVMRMVTPGSANSKLVTSTQSRGSMYRYWSGNAAQKAELVRTWVVTYKAAQTR
jgi:hypothetical protein